MLMPFKCWILGTLTISLGNKPTKEVGLMTLQANGFLFFLPPHFCDVPKVAITH